MYKFNFKHIRGQGRARECYTPACRVDNMLSTVLLRVSRFVMLPLLNRMSLVILKRPPLVMLLVARLSSRLFAILRILILAGLSVAILQIRIRALKSVLAVMIVILLTRIVARVIAPPELVLSVVRSV
jgi:hypothetical protein